VTPVQTEVAYGIENCPDYRQ